MSTEGRKYDAGKPEFSLLPPFALEAVAKVLTIGAQKYAVDNWKYVPNGAYRYKNAAMRHLNEYIKGNKNDDETGLNHLAHAICCLMFMLDADESGKPLAPSVVVRTDSPIIAGVPKELLPGYAFNPNLNYFKGGIADCSITASTINLSGTAYPVKQKE